MSCGQLIAASLLLVLSNPSIGRAQDVVAGKILDDVKCAADSSESYALYLPSSYSHDRQWSVLLAFHPSARGRAMVEKYQAAAEQYGYIVAGSNTSRNGPWSVSMKAVQAMSSDVGRRFSIEAQRVYLTGMSGGARVAMQVALDSKAIAGVIASSAGFPDSRPRESVTFAVFGTAGSEDFNYVEMRMLDRALKSPHRLAVFNGGHTLPTDAVALDAIEWMELQAMKSGRRSRDETFIDRVIAKRRLAIDGAATPANLLLLDAIVADFKGLRDVSKEEARAAELVKDSDIKKTLARERSRDEGEMRTLQEMYEMEARLQDGERRFETLGRLKGRLSQWAQAASQASDSAERQQARRLLGAVRTGAAARVQDAEYLKLLQQYR